MTRKKNNPLPMKAADTPIEDEAAERPKSLLEATEKLVGIMEDLGVPIEDDPHVSP